MRSRSVVSGLTVVTARPTIDPSRRIIDLTVGELREVLSDVHVEFAEAEPTKLEEGVLDRAGTAKFLIVSTTTVDMLCREKGLPFYRVGDCKRFIKTEIIAWVKAQGQ